MPVMFIALRRYRDFRGRASRREFWSFAALCIGVFFAVLVLSAIETRAVAAGKAPSSLPKWVFLYSGWWLATATPWFAVQVRRLHDQGRSGWLALINLAAYLAMFAGGPWGVLLYAGSMLLMALPGQTHDNLYGPATSDQPDGTDHVSRDGDADGKSDVADPQPIALAHIVGRATEVALPPVASELRDSAAEHPEAPSLVATAPLPLETVALVEATDTGPSDTDRETGTVASTDGRFLCGGYSFSTRDQAIRFAERRRNPTIPARDMLSPTSLPEDVPRAAPRLVALSQAPASAAHASTVSLQTIAQANSPSWKGFIAEEGKSGTPSSDNAQEDVVGTADGRFSCFGYSFSTREQAVRFAERKHNAATLPPDIVARPPKPAVAPSGGAPARPVSPPPRPAALVSAVARVTAPSPAAPHRPPASAQALPCWIGPATPVQIADIGFSAELLYFGNSTRSTAHRALVNPELPIGRQADSSGQTLSYWPSYTDLAPEGRRAYLQWLAAGRRDPATSIGYVFLFFYGLERRLIAEKSQDDAPAILAEVDALLAVYGGHHSFQRYATALIDAAAVMLGSPSFPPRATPNLRVGWEIPIGIRLHLGRKVHTGQPIDAEDALCWALSHPQIPTRTAVTRCFDAFRVLWHEQFQQSFPQGIKVRTSKTRLHYAYRAASSEFTTDVNVGELPDIAAMNGPLAKLDALLATCVDALDPLSRLLGRSPDEAGGVLAAALSPAAARSGQGAATFLAARAAFLAAMGDEGYGRQSLATILSTLLPSGFVTPERRAHYAKRLPDILDAMAIGFEPDKRFGPSVPLAEETILCLFARTGAIQPVEGRKAYRLARTMVEISVLAAMADSVVLDVELQSIVSDLAMVAGLDEPDKQRLRAHSLALVANPPKLRAATKRLLGLSEGEKDVVVAAVVHAILADQRVTPTEVRFLESLYKALGRPQEDVYTRLHAGAATPPTPGAARPLHRTGTIDSARLARIQRETASVSNMLADIFRDDEVHGPSEIMRQPVPAESALPGLDGAHTRVLLGLVAEPLAVDAFETLCRANRLLPGGAIETINDWAFDRFDDLAVEDDDLIRIQSHLIEAISTMSMTA